MNDILENFEEKIQKDTMYKSTLELISNELDISFKSIHGYNYNTLKSNSKNRVYQKYLLSIISVLLIPFLLIVMLLKRNKRNKKKSDITFDEWRNDSFNDYYKNIAKKLNNQYLINRFLSAKPAYDIKYVDKDLKSIKNMEFINKKIVFKLLKFSIINYKIILNFHKLNKKYNINFLFLYLKFLFAYVKFHCNAIHLNTKVFISALDFNSHLLKYEIFAKYNIQYICIQSSNRTNCLLLYKGADIIFSLGEHQSKLYKNITNSFNEIIPIGSIKCSDYYGKNIEKKHDILFVEQYYNFDNLEYAKNKNYIKILGNLIQFSKEYPQYKILYRTREEKRQKNNILIGYENIHTELENSSIIIDSKENSYDKVLESKIVIGYFSTLCFESIGLNIPALFCYYDNYEFELFDLENSEEDIIIRDNEYNTFKTSILQKLHESDNRKYFSKYKKIYMNQDENTINDICKKIKDIVYNESKKI